MTESRKSYPIHEPEKTDLQKILELIDNGDLRNIENLINDCRCGNCGEFAINTFELNQENKELEANDQ